MAAFIIINNTMPAPKDYIKIPYPRKCGKCDHLSNTGAAHSFHQRKHEPIPTGQLCSYDCGNLATVRTTHGFLCVEQYRQCPAYSKKQSDNTTRVWKNNTKRKTKVKERFQKLAELKTLVIDPAVYQERKRYTRLIRDRGRAWAKKNGYTLGRKTLHVDHIFSISDGWNLKIPVEIMCHPKNLRVITATENQKKWAKSLHTLPELLEKIFF
jgi:hypothetical protein